jgi:heat shock protein HslJ
LTAFVLLALLVSGCGLLNREADGAWVLDRGSIDGTAFESVQGAPVTLVVERGAVSGSTGCNEYAVEAEIAGGRFELFPDRGITGEPCSGAAASVEDSYWDALQKSVLYRVIGDRLELEGEGTLLEFTRAG